MGGKAPPTNHAVRWRESREAAAKATKHRTYKSVQRRLAGSHRLGPLEILPAHKQDETAISKSFH